MDLSDIPDETSNNRVLIEILKIKKWAGRKKGNVEGLWGKQGATKRISDKTIFVQLNRLCKRSIKKVWQNHKKLKIMQEIRRSHNSPYQKINRLKWNVILLEIQNNTLQEIEILSSISQVFTKKIG